MSHNVLRSVSEVSKAQTFLTAYIASFALMAVLSPTSKAEIMIFPQIPEATAPHNDSTQPDNQPADETEQPNSGCGEVAEGYEYPRAKPNRYTQLQQYESGKVALKLANRLAASAALSATGKDIVTSCTPDQQDYQTLSITYDTNEPYRKDGKGVIYTFEADMKSGEDGVLDPNTVTRVAIEARGTDNYYGKKAVGLGMTGDVYSFTLERYSTEDAWNFELTRPRPAYGPDPSDPFKQDRSELSILRREAPIAVNMAADATHFRMDETFTQNAVRLTYK